MQARHPSPKEFAYLPIELAPLIDAASRGNWEELKALLDNGYSLRWFDPTTNQPAIHLIAQRAQPDLLKKIIEYSRIMNGPDSEAHQFIVLETSRDPVHESALLHNIIHQSQHTTNPEDDSYPISPASIYYAELNDKSELARTHLRRACVDPQLDFEACLAAIFQATARAHGEPGLMSLLEVISADCLDMKDEIITRTAIAEAFACKHESWAWHHLNALIKTNAPNLDGYLGAAIVSIARRGNSTLIFDLCERAKELNIDKSAVFIQSLAHASAGALVNEHFLLAKIIMQMVPHFEAKPSDLIELQKWPANKVESMFRAIRNYKIFTDIALHSGLASHINSMAWSHALKKEYGLANMSDAGFNYLIHHPDVICILFTYRPDLSKTPAKASVDRGVIQALLQRIGHDFPVQEMHHFLNALCQSREAAKKSTSHHHFFRIRYLLDEHTDKRATPSEEQACLKIKAELSALLSKYRESRTPETKDIATRLHTELLDMVTLQMIKKTLDKNIALAPGNPLFKKCKEIFNKHQEVLKVRSGTSVGKK